MTFEPQKYLSKVSGRDYLEVKWRLVWLRSLHPDARITTELTQHTQQAAVFRAAVEIPGAGAATGWGMCAASEFGDYLEKAETKALGRALGALGFGTQFTFDYDMDGRVVDSPVGQAQEPPGGWHPQATQATRPARALPPAPRPQQQQQDEAITPNQSKFLLSLIDQKMLGDMADEIALAHTGYTISDQTKSTARKLIDLIKNTDEWQYDSNGLPQPVLGPA